MIEAALAGADGLRYLIENPAAVTGLGTNVRRRAEGRDWGQAARELERAPLRAAGR